MIPVALLIAGGTLVADLIAKGLAARAKRNASETQSEAATEALNLQQEAFSGIQETFAPYLGAGSNATQQMQALTGALGPEAQAAAIREIEEGPQFNAMMEQGENAILQNASATGGLRGGNTQSALAQFRPQVLSALIDQRYGQLGGLAQMGLGAAQGAGGLGAQGAGMMGNMMLQRGAYDAGGDLAKGGFYAGIPGSIMEAIGAYQGLGGGGGKTKGVI